MDMVTPLADVPVIIQLEFQQFYLVPQFQFIDRVLDIPVVPQRQGHQVIFPSSAQRLHSLVYVCLWCSEPLFGTVSEGGFSFVPSRSSVAANSISWVSDASMVLSSVPGYLEALENTVEVSMLVSPAAPSLLGGMTSEFSSSSFPVYEPCD